MEPEAYVHRIGRTARAGKSGHAISFCDVEEKGLLKQVERLTKFEIPRERVPDSVPKSDEAAAKSGLAPKPVRGERDRSASIETVRTAPPAPQARPAQPTVKIKPRLNAAGRPMPSPDGYAPAPRSHGPRVDRRMDEGPREESREGSRHESRREARPEARRESRGESRREPRQESRPAPRNAGPKKPHPSKGHPRMHSENAQGGQPQDRSQGSSRGQAKPAKPAHAKPPHGKPAHGGPARFGQNPFAGGKPTRGSNFKGGTGFKGPKPSR